MSMMHRNRWEKAQQYELNWWNKRKKDIDLSYLKRFADELLLDLKDSGEPKSFSSILEIGSGPAGIITHLTAENRVGIDPLEHFYSTVPEYLSYRDTKVRYISSGAEQIDFNNDTFDLIIIDNVLDHCHLPESVLKETFRVLKPNGIVYFKQNIYHRIGKKIRNILESIEFDKGHPYNFTYSDLTKLFMQNGFNYKLIRKRGHLNQIITEIKMRNIKVFFRILTFMTRDKVTMILKKS